jgi:hypothetical protein
MVILGLPGGLFRLLTFPLYETVIREPEPLAIPLLPADLAEQKLLGCTVGGVPHLAQVPRKGAWVE